VPAVLTGLVVGVPRGRLFGETEDLVAEAFEGSLRRLERAGARIVEHGIDDLLAAMAEATATAAIAAVEAAEIHGDRLDTHAHLFDPRVHGRILRGREMPAPAYLRMMRRRAELILLMDARLRDVGVLALPATASSAMLTAPLLADDGAYTRANLLMLRNTMPANLFDLTAISLPMPDAPRPAGLMLVARGGEDHRLLAVAASAEAALRG
jgi:aspartyl-tRNA(Asn)/glutamyl-tRNA(Gln) amidotransferase subunit A